MTNREIINLMNINTERGKILMNKARLPIILREEIKSQLFFKGLLKMRKRIRKINK